MSSEPELERAESAIEPPGARLRAAREAAGLGQSDVAAELRLGVETIDALEHDAVERLPAPIFVRGYLRSYAALIGLPAQELVDAYDGSVGRGQAQGLMAGPVQQQLVGARRRNYLVWLLVLAAAVAAGWWFQQRSLQPPEQAASPAAEAPSGETEMAQSPLAQRDTDALPSASDPDGATADEPDPGAEAPPAEAGSLPPLVEPQTPPPEDVAPAPEETPMASAAPEADAIEPEPAPQPLSAAPAADEAQQATAIGDTLSLAFSDRSWVEVYAASGERLLYRLANAGESRTVQGEAPFRLVLGNAPAVRVELNGTQVDIAAHTSGRTARFSVAP